VKHKRITKDAHFIHDCCPLQQVSMAEKVSACGVEGWVAIGKGEVTNEEGLGSDQAFALRTYIADADQNRQVRKHTDKVESF
jgi:hypothetical protein